MADEQQVAEQAAESNEQAAETGVVRAQQTRKGPSKAELKKQLEAYEAKGVITNADANAIHDLRRRIRETR